MCKAWSIAALVGAALLLSLAARPDAGEDKKPTLDELRARTVQLKKGDHIIFFGDSLTALAQKENGYVTLVRDTMTKKHADLGLKIGAVATGGHTVPQLLERLDRDVLSQKPTIVVIQIGCNDARRIDADVFKSGLEELIDRLHKAKVQVVQCSLTSVGEKHDSTNKDDAKLDRFAEIARGVALAKNVPLNDLRKAFVEHWKKNNPENKGKDILTYDGNHFNDAGHRFVAERMMEKFK